MTYTQTAERRIHLAHAAHFEAKRRVYIKRYLARQGFANSDPLTGESLRDAPTHKLMAAYRIGRMLFPAS